MTALVHICVQAQLNDIILFFPVVDDGFKWKPAMILSDFRESFSDVSCHFLLYQKKIHWTCVSQPLGVAGDSVEYKWAEADGSVTSMSPTGSKVCCFFGDVSMDFFSCRFNVVFLGDLGFFQVGRKSLFLWLGVKVGVPSSQEVVFYRCFQ